MNTVGRPRIQGQRRPGQTPLEEILDAAAELFATYGYASTSTRAIAEAVGMRQSSLYHHVGSKADILVALLRQTTAPASEVLDSLSADPQTALYDLAVIDATTLATVRWNLGRLYQLPELNSDEFGEFRAERANLAQRYFDLAAAITGSPTDPRCYLPFRIVESVIAMRSDGVDVAGIPQVLATAALRSVT